MGQTNSLLAARNSLRACKNSLRGCKKFPAPQRLAARSTRDINALGEDFSLAEKKIPCSQGIFGKT